MNIRKVIPRLLAGIAALCLSGCLLAPVPNPVTPRTSGTIRDAKTNRPIAGAIVSAQRARFRCQVRSNRKGEYTLPAMTQWSYVIYLGDPGLFPYDNYPDWVPYSITIWANGYQPALCSVIPGGECVTFWGAHYPPLRKDFSLKSAGH